MDNGLNVNNMNRESCHRLRIRRLRLLASRLDGLTLFVRFAFLAWRTLVLALVTFVRCAWAISSGFEQSATLGTVLFFLGPDWHLHAILTFPVLGLRFHTIRCSEIISLIFMLTNNPSQWCTPINIKFQVFNCFINGLLALCF